MVDYKGDNLRLEKYLGAFLGAAVGDALGWPNEQNSKKVGKSVPANKELFQKWIRRSGGKFWAHEEDINSGEYSDDTQMLIATARSLRYGANWNRHFTRYEIPAWLSYERGGGGATKRAAEVWKKGGMPWKIEAGNISEVKEYFAAGGNGVAMRILPHVFRNEHAIEEIMHQVVLNGIYTHGHPRALVGATLYADALVCLATQAGTLGYGELVNLLIDRKSKWGRFPKIQKLGDWIENADAVLNTKYLDLWNNVVDESINLLLIANEGLKLGALDMGNDVLAKLGCFDKKVNGSGTVTAVASIYLASKYASNPHIGLIEAAYLNNADTDTLASMVGGLLGMLHGTEWLSSAWFDIQDSNFLRKMIHYTPFDPSKEASLANQIILFDTTNPSLKSKLKDAKVGDTITTLPFHLLTVVEKKLNRPNAKGILVHTIKLKSEEGQTIYVKTFEKSSGKLSIPSEYEEDKKSVGQKEIMSAVDSDKQKLDVDKDAYVKREDPDRKELQVPKVDVQSNTNPVRKQLLINANKLRSFVNVLPENMPTDQYLFLISDIMLEIERVGTGKLDERTYLTLKDRWSRFCITIQDIERIIRILINY